MPIKTTPNGRCNCVLETHIPIRKTISTPSIAGNSILKKCGEAPKPPCVTAAAVTQGGLGASPHFFRMLFPAMLGVLIVFRIGIWVSRTQLQRPFGVVLIGTYILVTILSYTYGPGL